MGDSSEVLCPPADKGHMKAVKQIGNPRIFRSNEKSIESTEPPTEMVNLNLG